MLVGGASAEWQRHEWCALPDEIGVVAAAVTANLDENNSNRKTFILAYRDRVHHGGKAGGRGIKLLIMSTDSGGRERPAVGLGRQADPLPPLRFHLLCSSMPFPHNSTSFGPRCYFQMIRTKQNKKSPSSQEFSSPFSLT